MTYPRRLALALCLLIAFLVLPVGQGAGEETPKPTTFRVLAPERCKQIWIDGKRVPSKAVTATDLKADNVRDAVTTAPPAKGKKEHEVTAVWRSNDYTKFYRTARVAPKPGETVVVDLRKEDPKNRDH